MPSRTSIWVIISSPVTIEPYLTGFSPLFPFVHGLARWLLAPTVVWAPTVMMLTNCLIYLIAVIAFHFFWREVFGLYMSHREKELEGKDPILLKASFGFLDMPFSYFYSCR